MGISIIIIAIFQINFRVVVAYSCGYGPSHTTVADLSSAIIMESAVGKNRLVELMNVVCYMYSQVSYYDD